MLEWKYKGELAIFTIVERTTGYYITIKIDGKIVRAVANIMKLLKIEFREKYN